MRSRILWCVVGCLMIPTLVTTTPSVRRFCGEPSHWVMLDGVAASMAEGSETIAMRQPNWWCSVLCFPFAEVNEGFFEIFAPDRSLIYSGTFRAEVVRLKDYGCSFEGQFMLGGRAIFKVQFTTDDGDEFAGSMFVESTIGPAPANAVDGIRVTIPELGFNFTQPIYGSMAFWLL